MKVFKKSGRVSLWKKFSPEEKESLLKTRQNYFHDATLKLLQLKTADEPSLKSEYSMNIARCFLMAKP